ncbi:unnamed protein product [Spirodela intermedia]|uniref:Uncharacterized protein n=1 Tax=Spirodela intermedia TaxID=51605 RepID=A0A7I8K3D9_SPIIN|nr:unnamed protein product [Spirodela intermedia]
MKDQEGCSAERLRALVGRGGWDLCVVWEVSQDKRFLELKACCCGGADSGGADQSGGGDDASQVGFTFAAWEECRDSKFPLHRRTRACAALAELPPSIPLNSTAFHAQAFLSGITRWTHPSKLLSGTNDSNEAVRTTRVLVPLPDGLVELFVTSHVPEDQETVDFVAAQFARSLEAAAVAGDDLHDPHAWIPLQSSPFDQASPRWDIHGHQSHFGSSALSLFEGSRDDDVLLLEGASIQSEKLAAVPFDTVAGINRSTLPESTVPRELGFDDKEPVKRDGQWRAGFGGEGIQDQMDEGEEEQKIGKSARQHSCKNLVAERKRREKLKDRLYILRALVPKISKMDRASILGDAIEFVKDLQNQVKRLQEQLEETNPEEDGGEQGGAGALCNGDNSDENGLVPEEAAKLHHTGNGGRAMELAGSQSSPCADATTKPRNTPKDSRRSSTNEKQENQMEPQVEVSQVGSNRFFLKVFCEHRRGGFVRLMEAMTSLGLDIVNVNVTTSEPLVLNVFEVEKRDSEVVREDQVRSSLLRLTMASEGTRWPADPPPGPDSHQHPYRRHYQNLHQRDREGGQ